MIYPVSEDTLLLKKQLENRQLKGKKVLEVGTGNGLIAKTMLKKGANVTASDINQNALNRLPNEIKCINSDLFENISGRFDIIIFNPPYLPEEDDHDLEGSETWIGGNKGVELTRMFLKDASNHLKPEGEALIIVSSLADYQELTEDFDLELVDEEKLWFEKLFVMRLMIE